MRRAAGWITLVLFLAVCAGIVGAVLAFGTSTGVNTGGTDTIAGQATEGSPFLARTGWVRNNSPWPVTITGITTNVSGASQPEIYLSPEREVPPPAEGEVPVWATAPARFPLEIAGGQILYFGFGLTPDSGQVASFDAVTVDFRGPLPLDYDTTSSTFAVAAAAPDVDALLLAENPAGNPASLDQYISALREALRTKDDERLASVMGPDATTDDAAALRSTLKGYSAKFLVQATRTTDADTPQSLVFYEKDPANGLPPLTATWSGFRWSLTVA